MNVENKYVVLDVETNGTTINDDLLSISIYKPDDGKMYNRFLPLELSNEVETTEINGITKEDLLDVLPLSQDEVDDVIKRFELDKRIILTYGNIDEKFIKNYFKRKKLKGFELFEFYNFKRDVISSAFSRGVVTKDNLCKLFNIENVQAIHSGENDCVLEWELFKKIGGKKLFVDNKTNNVYEMNDDYIVPVSYLINYPNYKYYVKSIPKIDAKFESVKTFNFNANKNNQIPPYISGRYIEHLINTMLDVDKVDSICFLSDNKRKLKYIGNLVHKQNINMDFNDDGTITLIGEEHKTLEREINSSNEALKKRILPVIEFIRDDIFNGVSILSQELVVNSKDKILSLCDLSTENATMEIKNSIDTIEGIVKKIKYQLYYQSNGRDCYLLNIRQDGKRYQFAIYKITFSPSEQKNSLENRMKNFQSQIRNENIIVKEYINFRSPVVLYCKICEKEWKGRCASIVEKPNCPFCTEQER